MDPKFAEETHERLKEYFSKKHKPVVFTKAETDLLMRTIVGLHSNLVAHVRTLRTASSMIDRMEQTQSLTDLALLNEISRKLIQSEKP
jgi:hypothetical protein